jgi:CheY-like chemotaxis protein
MKWILLADDSPHAQRMGERILRDEGYSVVTVSDGETALLRLKDVRPDLVLADATLAGVSGVEICKFVKSAPDLANAKVALTVGALEDFDEAQSNAAGSDALVRKPFEATALIDLVSRLIGDAKATVVDRTQSAESATRTPRSVVVLDPEQVRAAVTIALDEALEPLIDRVTTKVLAALAARR